MAESEKAMERDVTGGAIRAEKVCEVISRLIEAIETTRCTVDEEVIAVSVLSQWLEDKVPADDRFPLAQARHRFMQLFPGFA